MKKKYKPGDKIMIKIDGKKIQTIIGDDDVQRLPHNKVLGYLVRGQEDGKTFDLNKLWIMHGHGLFSDEDIRFVYQNIGYSVCGYAEVFEDDKIENPVWDK